MKIGELSQNLQVKLLRVLQEKMFERVGGTKPVRLDVRFIAATNKTLKKEVEEGSFREDLYFRLNVVYLELPPLRRRQEDIRLLVDHFIEKYAGERHVETPVRGVAKEVERHFYHYNWPGNIRELENVIERATILCPGDIIQMTDLPQDHINSVSNTLQFDGIPTDAKLYDTLAMVEKTMIQRALKMSNNVQSHAAELLGIGKSGLNQKIKKYKLEIGGKS
jgi:two-component system NtrC family response regulator